MSPSLPCPLNCTVDYYLFNFAGYVKEQNPKKVTGNELYTLPH
jgi:hypothetical protein